MKVLVISDIHLKTWIFDKAEEFSAYRDGRQIGGSAMIVIDTETGKYEKYQTRNWDQRGADCHAG